MICNYHTHTFRCHHASGSEKEYIERAVAGGIKKMGFSDHIPFVFPDGFRSDYRVEPEDVADYFAAISALREEYRGAIDIYIGFEMEYYPLYFDEMYANALKWGAEYLILGQHFTKNEHPNGYYAGVPTDSEEELERFVDDTVAGISKGIFSYVAHPDLINFRGDQGAYVREMRRLCRAAKEAEIPLEINLLGIRRGRNYPAPLFWQIAGEVGCVAVLGFDSHTANDAYDADSIPVAEELARECGVRIDPDPELLILQ
ncbi:MAG: histidinol-phosphatase [Clostridia bacterium]|nr:histidinol-phosphatase [Clostridia bacterium]